MDAEKWEAIDVCFSAVLNWNKGQLLSPLLFRLLWVSLSDSEIWGPFLDSSVKQAFWSVLTTGIQYLNGGWWHSERDLACVVRTGAVCSEGLSGFHLTQAVCHVE